MEETAAPVAHPQAAHSQLSLPGARKAAILLVLLGDKSSGEIVKNLTEDEVQLVSREIARLDQVSSEHAEQILEEFCQLAMGRDFAMRGGLDYAKKMLAQAYGPEASLRLVDRLSSVLGNRYSSIEMLQRVDPAQLARYVQDEHPQTIALVLSNLSGAQAAGLLRSLPEELRAEVALRMGTLDKISPDVVNRIAAAIAQKSQADGETAKQSCGGVRAVADMLNRIEQSECVRILEVIGDQDPNLVESIRNLMFVFDDLLKIDVNQVRELMNRIDRKILTYALKGTSDRIKQHFMQTMSARAQEMLREEMEALGPVRIREVEAAQQQIIALVRQLESEGVLSLEGGGSEQYVV